MDNLHLLDKLPLLLLLLVMVLLLRRLLLQWSSLQLHCGHHSGRWGGLGELYCAHQRGWRASAGNGRHLLVGYGGGWDT